MRARYPFPLSTLLAGLLSLICGFACSVTFTDELIYTCEDASDCGGDDFVCVSRGPARVCCKPTGEEICDGLDNDCDGLIDNRQAVELCNGEDDNCDGRIDEIFNLQSDFYNCGTCGNQCPAAHDCITGRCIQRVEVQCFNGVDDDGNGLTDCEDPACDNRSCGPACVCRDLQPGEALCYDGEDNDGDGKTDCEDSDCQGRACEFQPGCECTFVSGVGGKKEISCLDGVDNDGDGKTDCEDEDCEAMFCTPPDLYFTCNPISSCAVPPCNSQQLCKCNGGLQEGESGALRCSDGIDNDCNGKVDCQEATCDGFPCTTSGGAPGACSAGACQ